MTGEQRMNAAIPLQYAVPPVPGYSSALVRTHSKLGLASFQIALGFPLLLLVLFFIKASAWH